jgi:hypothetical protein
MSVWDTLLYRQLDLADDVLKHPAYLEEAFEKGRAFGRAVMDDR